MSIRPFSNGTQYIDWQNHNCCRCARYDYDAENQKVLCDCEIEYALALACVMDGTVSDEIGKRIRTSHASRAYREQSANLS